MEPPTAFSPATNYFSHLRIKGFVQSVYLGSQGKWTGSLIRIVQQYMSQLRKQLPPPALTFPTSKPSERMGDHGAADGVLARYQLLLASPHQRFCTKCILRVPGKMDGVSYSYSSAIYESIEKATSPINGQEESYWLRCNYKWNEKFEGEYATAMEIERNMVPFYHNIRFPGHHAILRIREIYTSNDSQMIICEHIDHRLDNYLEYFREDLLSNDGLVTIPFRNIVRDLVDGLVFLHSRRLAHGNLRLSTTYCSINGEYRVKLAGFGYDSDAQNLEETQKSDWVDLGNLLHEALKILFKEETVRNQQYELLDLCRTLQNLELKKLKRETRKDYIMRHPALFTSPYRRCFYINYAVDFIERQKLEGSFVDDDVLSRKPWTENIGSKADFEKLVKLMERATKDYDGDIIIHPESQRSYDPNSGWHFIKFASYLLQYCQRRSGVHKDIQDIIGGDIGTAESYLRRYQPKMLMALKTVAEEAGFNIVRVFE